MCLAHQRAKMIVPQNSCGNRHSLVKQLFCIIQVAESTLHPSQIAFGEESPRLLFAEFLPPLVEYFSHQLMRDVWSFICWADKIA